MWEKKDCEKDWPPPTGACCTKAGGDGHCNSQQNPPAEPAGGGSATVNWGKVIKLPDDYTSSWTRKGDIDLVKSPGAAIFVKLPINNCSDSTQAKNGKNFRTEKKSQTVAGSIASSVTVTAGVKIGFEGGVSTPVVEVKESVEVSTEISGTVSERHIVSGSTDVTIILPCDGQVPECGCMNTDCSYILWQAETIFVLGYTPSVDKMKINGQVIFENYMCGKPQAEGAGEVKTSSPFYEGDLLAGQNSEGDVVLQKCKTDINDKAPPDADFAYCGTGFVLQGKCAETGTTDCGATDDGTGSTDGGPEPIFDFSTVDFSECGDSCKTQCGTDETCTKDCIQNTCCDADSCETVWCDAECAGMEGDNLENCLVACQASACADKPTECDS
jgi:hypothetical protein